MTTEIQVYAENMRIEAENMQSNVILAGIDASQVLNEFTIEERLESLELSDVADYLSKKEEEAMEDAKELEYELAR